MRIDVALGGIPSSSDILNTAERQFHDGLFMVVYNDASNGHRIATYHYRDGNEREALGLKHFLELQHLKVNSYK